MIEDTIIQKIRSYAKTNAIKMKDGLWHHSSESTFFKSSSEHSCRSLMKHSYVNTNVKEIMQLIYIYIIYIT